MAREIKARNDYEKEVGAQKNNSGSSKPSSSSSNTISSYTSKSTTTYYDEAQKEKIQEKNNSSQSFSNSTNRPSSTRPSVNSGSSSSSGLDDKAIAARLKKEDDYITKIMEDAKKELEDSKTLKKEFLSNRPSLVRMVPINNNSSEPSNVNAPSVVDNNNNNNNNNNSGNSNKNDKGKKPSLFDWDGDGESFEWLKNLNNPYGPQSTFIPNVDCPTLPANGAESTQILMAGFEGVVKAGEKLFDSSYIAMTKATELELKNKAIELEGKAELFNNKNIASQAQFYNDLSNEDIYLTAAKNVSVDVADNLFDSLYKNSEYLQDINNSVDKSLKRGINPGEEDGWIYDLSTNIAEASTYIALSKLTGSYFGIDTGNAQTIFTYMSSSGDNLESNYSDVFNKGNNVDISDLDNAYVDANSAAAIGAAFWKLSDIVGNLDMDGMENLASSVVKSGSPYAEGIYETFSGYDVDWNEKSSESNAIFISSFISSFIDDDYFSEDIETGLGEIDYDFDIDLDDIVGEAA